MYRIPNKVKYKIRALFKLYFKFRKVLLTKIWKIQPPDLLFIVLFIRAYNLIVNRITRSENLMENNNQIDLKFW